MKCGILFLKSKIGLVSSMSQFKKVLGAPRILLATVKNNFWMGELVQKKSKIAL